MKRLVLTIAILIGLAAPAWAGYAEGLAAYKRGDYATAPRELQPLAEQGVAEAQYYLGLMYDLGRGVPQDYAEAVKWYRKAAEQGYAGGQYHLGLMYRKGRGVPQDRVQAHLWLSLAAEGLIDAYSKIAHRFIKIVAAEMTPAQIAEAQRLAREWKPKHSR